MAELLMQPEGVSTRQGTGIRIYDDGRVFAYDESDHELKDGKVTGRRIEGKWRQHRTAAPGRIEELRQQIRSVDRAGLVDMQGKNRKGKGRPSLLTLRLDGQELRSCYRGLEGGDVQESVLKLTKKIMGEAHDDEVNRRVPTLPAASLSAMPTASAP